MIVRPTGLVAMALILFALPVRAHDGEGELGGQSLNLRDLLTNFLLGGVSLAPPAGGGIDHSAHFTGEGSSQFLAVKSMNAALGRQISAVPLPSSAGGFAYDFDPSTGMFVRPTQSFGSVYVERPLTLGHGKFNIGYHFSQFTFDRIDDLSLRDGDVRLVFTHEDEDEDDIFLPYWEGDVLAARMFLNIDANIQTLTATYGAGPGLDLGIAVPFVDVEIQGSATARVERLSTGDGSSIHEFPNGTNQQTFFQSGTARGLGDVVLSGKYQVVPHKFAAIGRLHLPTGDERNLLGTGAWQGSIGALAALNQPMFNPHAAFGIKVSELKESMEFYGAVGGDWAPDPKLTLSADLLARFLPNAGGVDSSVETVRFIPEGGGAIQSEQIAGLSFDPDSGVEYWNAAVGMKLNLYGNFLLTLNGLFPLLDGGLQDDFSSLIGVDYSF